METSQHTPDKLWSKSFVVLMAANLFMMFAIFMTNTTLPVYLADLGVEVSRIGFIVGCFAATAIGIRPVAGPAFDSFPRKNLLIITQVICIISLLGYAFVEDATIIMCFRLFHGLGIGCSGPLLMSLVGDYIPRTQFAMGMSIYATSTSLAQIVGPAMGLFLADVVGYRILYIACGVSITLSLLSIVQIKEIERELLPFKVQLNRTFAKEVWEHTLVIALWCLAYAAVASYLVLMAREYGIENVGFFFAIYAVAVIVIAPQYGRLSDKFGNERVLILGFVFMVLSFVMLHFAHTVPLLCVTAVVSALGYGASAPQIQSLAMRSSDPSRSAVVGNTYFTGVDVGFLMGPTLAGIVASTLLPTSDSLGQAYSNMWFFMIIPVILGFIIIVRWNIALNRKKKNQQ